MVGEEQVVGGGVDRECVWRDGCGLQLHMGRGFIKASLLGWLSIPRQFCVALP